MKQYRFFYHYRRSTGGMTVHFKGRCYACVDVVCNVPCQTKRNKEQPRLVLQGFCSSLSLDENTITIS